MPACLSMAENLLFKSPTPTCQSCLQVQESQEKPERQRQNSLEPRNNPAQLTESVNSTLGIPLAPKTPPHSIRTGGRGHGGHPRERAVSREEGGAWAPKGVGHLMAQVGLFHWLAGKLCGSALCIHAKPREGGGSYLAFSCEPIIGDPIRQLCLGL